jgi:hypothetical protein
MILEIYPCKRRSDFPHKTEALHLFHVDLLMRALRKFKERTERILWNLRPFPEIS